MEYAHCIVLAVMLTCSGSYAQVLEPCPKRLDPRQVLFPTASEDLSKYSEDGAVVVEDGKTVVLLFGIGGSDPGETAVVIFTDKDGKKFSATGDPLDRYRFTVTATPGRYVLTVVDPVSRLQAPSRYVDLPSQTPIRVGLGRPNAPFFRSQDSIVPFEPSTDLIALVFEFNALGKEKAQALLDSLTTMLPLVPHWDSRRKLGPIRGEGEAILVRLDPFQKEDLSRSELISKIRELVPVGTRVGTPVDVGLGAFRMIDNEFVVRPTKPEHLWVLDKLQITVLRRLGQSESLLHVALPSEDYRENLAMMECLVSRSYLDVAEPDLVFEIADHAGLAAGYPNDPRYSLEQSTSTTGFGRQQFREAWTALFNAHGYRNIGSSDIYVAVLERNIWKLSSEFACPDSSGWSPQIATCWDATTAAACGLAPANAGQHGFGVLGIIAACVNNASELAGMAPGVRKIAVRFAQYVSATGYSDLLRWVARTPNGNPIACPFGLVGTHPCTWAPIAHPADVVNNSYGLCSAIDNSYCAGTWWQLPLPISQTFSELVNDGRQISGSKLGIVLVYSAGNDGQPNLYKQPFARDPRTIGISNCMIDVAGDERLTTYWDEVFVGGAGSNYGDGIKICALGHKIPTVQFSGCSTTAAGTGCIFAGTSAAAPEVSAAATLVLTAHPKLKWNIVRKVLQVGADKIDLLGGGWANGYSPKYGTGRLNACKAVRNILGNSCP